jgi:hypothetical protein
MPASSKSAAKINFQKSSFSLLTTTRTACDNCGMSKQNKPKTAAAAPEAPQKYEWIADNSFTGSHQRITKEWKAWRKARKEYWKARDAAAAAPEAPQRISIGKVDGELVDENGFYITSAKTKAEIVRRYNSAEQLAEALRVLVDHASEMYPHFESERGQRDIADAQAALAQFEKGAH